MIPQIYRIQFLVTQNYREIQIKILNQSIDIAQTKKIKINWNSLLDVENTLICWNKHQSEFRELGVPNLSPYFSWRIQKSFARLHTKKMDGYLTPESRNCLFSWGERGVTLCCSSFCMFYYTGWGSFKKKFLYSFWGYVAAGEKTEIGSHNKRQISIWIR